MVTQVRSLIVGLMRVEALFPAVCWTETGERVGLMRVSAASCMPHILVLRTAYRYCGLC